MLANLLSFASRGMRACQSPMSEPPGLQTVQASMSAFGTRNGQTRSDIALTGYFRDSLVHVMYVITRLIETYRAYVLAKFSLWTSM